MIIPGNPYIDIDFKPGVYAMSCGGASGKSYLAHLLTKHQITGSYTYNDYLHGVSLTSRIKRETQVLLLDRYDMYYSDIPLYLLKKFVANGGMLLIDCKLLDNMRIEYDFCIINSNKDKIAIYT